MYAKGTFEVSLKPQDDEGFPAGRMTIAKSYEGDVAGRGIGQMISKRTDNGTAAYYAIEEFSGTVNGRRGAFTLVHRGFLNNDTKSMDVGILAGSGSGELQEISGAMEIIQDGDGHAYELNYELPGA